MNRVMPRRVVMALAVLGLLISFTAPMLTQLETASAATCTISTSTYRTTDGKINGRGTVTCPSNIVVDFWVYLKAKTGTGSWQTIAYVTGIKWIYSTTASAIAKATWKPNTSYTVGVSYSVR